MKNMHSLLEKELLDTLHKVLKASIEGDKETYEKYTVDDLSSYEWYIAPYRIDNVNFHLNLLEEYSKVSTQAKKRFDILSPRIQIYNQVAIITFTLLITKIVNRLASYDSTNETRIFVFMENVWKMVHFHKSPTVYNK